jgi:hypothetical protein
MTTELGISPSAAKKIGTSPAICPFSASAVCACSTRACTLKWGLDWAVRAMRMFLSGVGVTPEAPQPVAEPYGCGGLRLKWPKPDGHGFPVHKYRLFRHSHALTAPHGTASLVALGSGAGRTADRNWIDVEGGEGALSQWTLLHDGEATEFVDAGTLLPGTSYDYRLTAWNLFGHSEDALVSGSPAHRDSATRRLCAHGDPSWLPRQLSQVGGTVTLLGSASWAFWLFAALASFLVSFLVPVLSIFLAVVRARPPVTISGLSHGELLLRGAIVRAHVALAARAPALAHFVPVAFRTLPAALGTVQTAHADVGMAPFKGTSLTETCHSTKGSNSSHCSICNLRLHSPFKAFVSGSRYHERHTCKACWMAFCSACGKTEHPWYFTCPVGGNCCCRKCGALTSDPGGESLQRRPSASSLARDWY